MDLNTSGTFAGRGPFAGYLAGDHVIDQLIAERAQKLSQHPLWPLLRPFLYRFLGYDAAVKLADRIADMPGYEAFAHISALLKMDVSVRGITNIPEAGAVIVAPNHPTGLPDGIALFDALTPRRKDIAIFANRDALRVSPGFRDVIIPVEWREDLKSRAKTRDTLEMTHKAFDEGKCVVLFPSGRIAFWHEDRLTERPWQVTVAALPRRYHVPVIPMHISGRNSGLFYWLSKQSTELRDMTIFYELLNKKRASFRITVGKPIPHELLDGDHAEIAAKLQDFTTRILPNEPEAEFRG